MEGQIENGVKPKPIIIGITGGTASGKTTLCKKIIEALGLECTLLTLDSFYYGLSENDHDNSDLYDFDHPKALDFELCYQTLTKLLNYEDCEIPVYDFALH